MTLRYLSNTFFCCLLLLVLCVFVGCSENKRLTGKVTFTDGKPAPQGMIYFTMGNFQARAEIQPDGTYAASSVKMNDGLPPGEYKVSLTGVTKTADGGKGGMSMPIALCDDKYQSPDTSGLVCTIPAPNGTFDIVLDPHPKNYP